MNAWLNIAEILQRLRTEHRRLRFYTLIYVSCSLLLLGLGVAWLGAHWDLHLFVWLWVLFFSMHFYCIVFLGLGKDLAANKVLYVYRLFGGSVGPTNGYSLTFGGRF